MLRTGYFIISMAFISGVNIDGLLNEAPSAELPVVEAPAGALKVRLTSTPSLFGNTDAEYALNQLAMPYIKDKSTRN